MNNNDSTNQPKTTGTAGLLRTKGGLVLEPGTPELARELGVVIYVPSQAEIEAIRKRKAAESASQTKK